MDSRASLEAITKIVPLIPLHQDGTFIVYSMALNINKIKSQKGMTSYKKGIILYHTAYYNVMKDLQ